MNSPSVILVNEKDEPIGSKEKIAAHLDGDLHRAFSVFIFNTKGHFLIQKRAASKYHTPNLWTNSCCSHQDSTIPDTEFTVQRLQEEIGIHTPLTFLYKFIYKSKFDNGLTEFEFDHVYYGITDTPPILNPAEASAFEYVDIKTLKNRIKNTPEEFTSWFKIIIEQHFHHFETIKPLTF